MTANFNKFLLFTGAGLLGIGIVFPRFTSWVVMDRGSRLDQFNAIASDIGSLLMGLGVLIGTSAFLYRYQSVRTVYVKFVVPLVMVCISIGFGLITIEIVLHFMYRDVQIGGANSPSGFTFYSKYYKYNSWGFRDTERESVKPSNTFRILVLGDSFTFGAGVKFKEQLYPALLEDRLNGPSPDAGRFEVINTGVKGLSTKQELEYLLEKGLALNPDLIIVGHVLNDAETKKLKREITNKARNTTLLPAKYHRILNAYSFTYYLARTSIVSLMRNMRDSKNGMTGYDDYLEKLYRGDNLIAYKRVVADLARVCQERDIAALWVSFPRIRYARADPYPFAHVTEIVRGIVLQNRFEFLDLQPAIRNSAAINLTVSPWDDHPNDIVHSIAAVQIYHRLIATDLIPLPQT